MLRQNILSQKLLQKTEEAQQKKISSSGIIIVNLYTPNIKTPKCIKQIATETEVTDSSIIRGEGNQHFTFNSE